MNSICPGPFALVNAHWTLLVEEQVLKILAISEIKDGRLAFRQELSTPVTFVGVDTFLHLVDILSLVYVSLVVSFWKKSWWILLFIAQPLGIVIRQTLQHFALATTVLDDKRPVQNSRLPSHIIEAQDPQFSWTRVPSFDEVKTWGGSFRGKRKYHHQREGRNFAIQTGQANYTHGYEFYPSFIHSLIQIGSLCGTWFLISWYSFRNPQMSTGKFRFTEANTPADLSQLSPTRLSTCMIRLMYSLRRWCYHLLDLLCT